MLKAISVLSAALLTTGALAQARPSTTAMNCRQAAGLVASRGAIVLSNGPVTYERYVGGLGHCALSEYIEPAYAPTEDNPQCPIGYRCRSGPPPQNEQ
jgi:hypothetical protein